MPVVKEEVWADKDGNAVPFGDPRGKTVLFGAGATISDADAEKYGIGKEVKEPETARQDVIKTDTAGAAEVGNVESDATVSDDETDGRGYTKEALLNIAKDRGITVPSRATKADIVALLDSTPPTR